MQTTYNIVKTKNSEIAIGYGSIFFNFSHLSSISEIVVITTKEIGIFLLQLIIHN